MQPMYYIGLDVHKRNISYCVKDSGGHSASMSTQYWHRQFSLRTP